MEYDFKIIDTHNHLWKLEGKHFDWINDEMEKIRRHFSVDDLEKILKSNDVDYSILVQAVPTIEETEWLLSIAEDSQFVKAVVGWCDIKKGEDCKHDLEKLLDKSELLKGIRYMSQDLPGEHLVDEDFIKGCKEVGRLGLVYELLIKNDQLEYATELVKRCPEVNFVIEHIAKPDIKNNDISKWSKDIEEISKYENVNIKVSGMVTEADWNNWKYSDFKPYLDQVFNSFGEDRIVFGSDWPVLLVAAEYKEVVGILNTWLNENGNIDKSKVFYKNAKRIYKL